jgi:hypothetical protein
MFGHFYHGTLEKVTKAFGTLFNRIYVVKYDASGNEVERNLVPINYANRHAYIARLEAQPELEDLVAVEAIFPRMAFEITGIAYDSNRKLNTIHRHKTDLGDDFTVNTAYQSVAYNVDFGLTIIAKHVVDANQILEQILPYFTPAYTIKINAIPEMGYEENIAIELNAVVPSDNYQQELEMQQRQVRFDLSFTAKINFHGPVDRSGIIKKAQIDILTPKDFDDATLSKTPRIARSTTITDPPDANPGDDFGYTQTWQEFADRKKFNPVTGTDEEIPE